MKNFYLLISFCLFLSITNAQNPTPNPGFENWTQNGNHLDPNNWNTLNPNTAITGILTCTRATGVDAHSGSYAIKLTTKSVFGITANGIASTGTLITTPPYGVTGGIPYTGRPDSITGWYKCTPSGSDYGFVEFQLLDATNDTVGFVHFNMASSTVSSYTRFSFHINYYNSSTPTHSIWILSSSAPSNPVVNSSAWFDDLQLVFNTSGIQSLSTKDDIRLIQNSSDGKLIVSNGLKDNFSLSLFDINGKKIISQNIIEGTNTVDASASSNGIYFYRIINQKGLIKYSGKVLIEK